MNQGSIRLGALVICNHNCKVKNNNDKPLEHCQNPVEVVGNCIEFHEETLHHKKTVNWQINQKEYVESGAHKVIGFEKLYNRFSVVTKKPADGKVKINFRCSLFGCRCQKFSNLPKTYDCRCQGSNRYCSYCGKHEIDLEI